MDNPETLDPFWIFIILGALVLFVLGCIAVFLLVTR